jgi:D-glycero-alpha-D-manno-heptose-7-phosphate kinase
MIITQTPFRISFFGGGTDYRPFFEEHGGSVLSTTFNKYCYTTVRYCPPFFDYHTQLRYAKVESVRRTEEIEHPLVRNCMIFTGMHNLSIAYDADLPARSGLGSSSSFAVGLLLGMYAKRGVYVGKRQLAEEAIHIERELCNEDGGWQDQIAAAYGGLNRIDFDSAGFHVHPVIISAERRKQLSDRLLMLFTGISRISADVAKEQMVATKSKSTELLEMKSLVHEAERILTSGCDINEFGRLLNHTWSLKRSLTNRISTNYIDEIYEKALRAGAIGGKLLGAGGGGFMVFFAEPDSHAAIKKALDGLIHIPIEFEGEGAKIIHYNPDDIRERRHYL